MQYHLQVVNLNKGYSEHVALQDVSLGVSQGQIFGLLGPNGAGKSTLLRIVNRIIAPDSGEILLYGKPMTNRSIAQIGYLPEEKGLYRKMKVGEHALYLARLRGLSKSEAKCRIEHWFERLGMQSWWYKRVEELSKGMQQKVQFICAVAHEPELVILDEPFSGLDPVNAEVLKRELLSLRDEGKTIIYSTHDMQSVEDLCDSIAMLHRSHLVLEGTVSELRRRYASGDYWLSVSRSGLSDERLDQLFACGYSEVAGRVEGKIATQGGVGVPSDVLELLPGVHILELKEELPTVHDIFLQTIQDL